MQVMNFVLKLKLYFSCIYSLMLGGGSARVYSVLVSRFWMYWYVRLHLACLILYSKLYTGKKKIKGNLERKKGVSVFWYEFFASDLN